MTMEQREREIQIETLTKAMESIKAELKELKGAPALADLIDEEPYFAMWGTYRNSNQMVIRSSSCLSSGGAWEHIRKLTLYVFCASKHLTHIKWANLNREEQAIAGEMASELIAVYNKYFRKIYAEYMEDIDKY